MQKLTSIHGVVAPLNRSNVDTDAIIPKQFLKSIKRTGFGPNLFDEWRYLDYGDVGIDNSKRPLNPDFVLNQERYQGAKILLAQSNFGCGSSREHAPWAIKGYGLDAILAPSFADIFYNNSFKNALLPIILPEEVINQLFAEVEQQPQYKLLIDVVQQTIQKPDGSSLSFDLEDFKKHCLINGLDDISLTLEKSQKIRQFEQQHLQSTPWVR